MQNSEMCMNQIPNPNKYSQREVIIEMSKNRIFTQAVSSRPLTKGTRVRYQAIPRGIRRLSGDGKGSSPKYSLFHCQYHSIVALRAYISPGDDEVAAVQRHSLTPST
jgi:hypothetical protein